MAYRIRAYRGRRHIFSDRRESAQSSPHPRRRMLEMASDRAGHARAVEQPGANTPPAY